MNLVILYQSSLWYAYSSLESIRLFLLSIDSFNVCQLDR